MMQLFQQFGYFFTDPPRFFKQALKPGEILTATVTVLVVAGIGAFASILGSPQMVQSLSKELVLRLYLIFLSVQLADALVYGCLAMLGSSYAGGKASFLSFLSLGLYGSLPFLLAAIRIGMMPVSIAWSYFIGYQGLRTLLKINPGRLVVLQLVLALAVYGTNAGMRNAAVQYLLHQQASEPEANQAPQLLVFKPAPDITIRPYGGQPMQLSSLKGQVVVLDFWATWCPPCRQALPVISQVAEFFRSEKVKVFALATSDDAEKARKYLDEHQFALTGAVCDDDALRAFRVRSIPQTVIIDKEGVVHEVVVGFSSDEYSHLLREIGAAVHR